MDSPPCRGRSAYVPRRHTLLVVVLTRPGALRSSGRLDPAKLLGLLDEDGEDLQLIGAGDL